MKRLSVLALAAVCGAAGGGVGAAWGQEAARPPEPAARPGRLPSLDEALGLKKPGGAPVAPSRDEAALTEHLSPEEVRDEISQAVKLMGDAASRVADGKDVGVETQRLQEEILQKLNKLLDEAKRQEQEKQKQQQQQQQGQQNQQNQQNQSQQQQQQSGKQNQQQKQDQASQQQQQKGGNGSGNKEGLKEEKGDLRPTLSSGAAWGNLPPHVREQLMQGFGDSFSSMYKRMTEAYYKRLAEEPKRD